MPRTRPLHPSRSVARRLPLPRMVAEINSALDDAEPGTLLRVTGDPLQVAYLPLEGHHPLNSLLGFVAPQSWLAIGVHCRGRAYPLGQSPASTGAHHPGRDVGFPVAGPSPVVITTLVDRSGRGAGLLRRCPPGAAATPAAVPAGLDEGAGAGTSSPVTRYDDAPEGVVGDACRRALGLPTPPPPPSTAELWLRLWLDRVIEATPFADEPHRRPSWDTIAALHPAAPSSSSPLMSAADQRRLDDPYALAEATMALAQAWPWPRLRRDPEVLDLAGPPLSRQLAAWMDDGMFARFLLADLAALPLLAHTTQALLPVPVLEGINEAILAVGLRWTSEPEVVQ